ncbi:MAG: hypothetical protein JWM85_2624 [Acidimicrobiaceae bacterium]|nr:hypothetical protein [Acidimicrobiaceae bacterium]
MIVKPAGAQVDGVKSEAVAPARLLLLMGSGELAPTMVKVHRSALARLGPAPVPSLLLATPFGFQENSNELAARAVAYFAESLGTPLEVGGLAGGSEYPADPLAAERLTSALRRARYIFSGPGSPTYALEHWRTSVVPQLLAEKLDHGGAVVFASAAALTLGAFTVPVYEIYKVGEEPHWLEGLDLLARAGLKVAVVPHYNNAEGGTHDTRFCYLGERRLRLLEAQLPEDAFVLGIDEHTSLLLDLAAGTATVGGLGVVTVRRAGHSVELTSGTLTTIAALVSMSYAGPGGAGAVGQRVDAGPLAPDFAPTASGTSPLVQLVRDSEARFAQATADRDAEAAIRSVLELEERVSDWATDIPGGDELERARASVRSMVVELGHLAVSGLQDPAAVVGPYIDLLLELRAQARAARRFDLADQVRDGLAALDVQVHDTPEGTGWELAATKGS